MLKHLLLKCGPIKFVFRADSITQNLEMMEFHISFSDLKVNI